ncbi:UNVERIFIED_CONTAM: protein PHLOEM PROTEIN 2-LIKE A10 [Sesamum calycinum]|uniref:Protein PHLOEM PROTEIN 2-LIKE A10 n=1 Tax=Sesamum calycinum TaxID=2727403 RepID=A0AAW2P7P1_9LAMI
MCLPESPIRVHVLKSLSTVLAKVKSQVWPHLGKREFPVETTKLEYVAIVELGTLNRLLVISWRKVRMMTSHHAPYALGDTRATIVGTKDCHPVRAPNPKMWIIQCTLAWRTPVRTRVWNQTSPQEDRWGNSVYGELSLKHRFRFSLHGKRKWSTYNASSQTKNYENTPFILRAKDKRILKLLGCLVSMAKMVSESASLITLILKDLKEFLTIDQVEIPNSLKQLQKIARSEEFSESVSPRFPGYDCWDFKRLQDKTSKSEIQEVMDLSLSADSLKTKSKVGIVDYGKNIGRIGPKNNGWVNSISSTLAVLRNRKFVLDVIGKVAFEIVRSVVEFFLWKMSELNRSVDVVVERI